MKEITAQEKAFCRLLVTGKSKTAAYVEAGLLRADRKRSGACGSARGLLKKPQIKEYMEELKAELGKAEEKATESLKEKLASAEWNVLEFYAREGQNPENSMKDRLHCADSYARCKGMFVNRVESTGDFVIDVVIDDG